eukprot:PhF_6_TR18550/c0_g1_i1/m.27095
MLCAGDKNFQRIRNRVKRSFSSFGRHRIMNCSSFENPVNVLAFGLLFNAEVLHWKLSNKSLYGDVVRTFIKDWSLEHECSCAFQNGGLEERTAMDHYRKEVVTTLKSINKLREEADEEAKRIKDIDDDDDMPVAKKFMKK